MRPRGGRHVHEAAGALRPEPGRGGPRGVEAPLEVHVDDRVPVFLRHLVEDGVAQDPGVVHDDVDPPETVDRLLDHPLRGAEAHDAVEVGLRLAARIANRAHRLEGGGPVLAVAGGGATRIVHDHLRAVRSEHLRDLGADAAPGAGDQRDLSFDQPRHEVLPRGVHAFMCAPVRRRCRPAAGVAVCVRSPAHWFGASSRSFNSAAGNAPGGPEASPALSDRRARSRTRTPQPRRRGARRACSLPTRCRRWR